MAKNKTGSKTEWKRLVKFEQENEKLRKEISKLRKHAKYSFVDNLEQKEERVKEGKPAYALTCENCGNNDISVISINRLDGRFEMKTCNNCNYKTRMKKIK